MNQAERAAYLFKEKQFNCAQAVFGAFTDVTGVDYYYEVVLLETLPPTATEEMITSGFDLSLYTCTPGGGNRVTVRCSRKEAF